MSTGKPSSPDPSRVTRLQEKGRHVKPVKFEVGSQQKQCASRKMTGSEEVVRNMSSVPCYLQRVEKEDTNQRKALNFGVLDWGSLEKWTYLQKQVAGRRVGNSPPSETSNASSSPFSAFGSLSTSTRSCDSPLAKEKSCRQRLRFDTYGVEKIQLFGSRQPEKQSFSGDLGKAECSLQQQCSVMEGMWDHLHETVHRGRVSCDVGVATKGCPGEVDRNSFSGSFPTDGISFTNHSPRVSYSCPFPSVASIPSSRNEVAASSTKGKHGKHDIIAEAIKGVRLPTSLRRDLSPHRLLRAGISRIMSHSVREVSTSEDTQPVTKGRQSPFRRMLSQFSGPIASSRAHRAQDVANINKLPLRDELELAQRQFITTDASSNAADSCQKEKSTISTKQALLKLAWKNGFPLFMFSSNDDNVLAATMGKRSIAERNDLECVYTLFSAHEVKKKESKITKQSLVYNVAGRMKVSSSSKITTEEPGTYSITREFVLLGSQLFPTGQPTGCLLNSELAAVIVKTPSRISESLSGIVAILPSGVHGFSDAGKPSPLIERWRCGGSCDCGGWDEGCLLTVLTDDKSSYGNGTQRIQLFNQGDARDKERVFTMIAYKEGVYTVEYGASISLLQAFTICIAALHSLMPTSLAKLHYSIEARNSEENTRKSQRIPTNYALGHPPLSPMGRT